ncbi:hypothetical protein DXG01_007110 [Tephrocybe rancida]|nr:hypothetical protein DXG01_007110 [Tephrocybe rancida]
MLRGLRDFYQGDTSMLIWTVRREDFNDSRWIKLVYSTDIPPYKLQQKHRRFHRAANFDILGTWDVHYCVVDWVGNARVMWECYSCGDSIDRKPRAQIAQGTVSQAISLVLAVSRSGFQKSNSVIDRLVRAAIQTGFLVAIFSLTSHMLFLKHPKSHYYGIVGLPAGRLYGISIMDTLLVRHSLREKSGVEEHPRAPSGSSRIWGGFLRRQAQLNSDSR